MASAPLRAGLRLASVPVCPVDSFPMTIDGGITFSVEIWERSEIDRLPANERPDGRLSDRGRFVFVIQPSLASA